MPREAPREEWAAAYLLFLPANDKQARPNLSSLVAFYARSQSSDDAWQTINAIVRRQASSVNDKRAWQTMSVLGKL